MAPSKSKVEETKYFFKVVETYRNYKRDNLKRLTKAKESFKAVPARYHELLRNEGYADHLQRIEKCIEGNHNMIKQLLGNDCKEFFYIISY